MPPIHDDAICLRHREWSETSQTVTLLTRGHGLVHGIAKGAFRDKSPFSGGFEHLQLGELGFINKPDRDLLILTDWDLTNPFPALRADYRAATLAMFACEITASLLAPIDPHPATFEALCAMLARTPHADPARLLSEYLLVLLDETGYSVETPGEGDTDSDGQTGDDDAIWAFDPASGTFTPDPEVRSFAIAPFEPSSRHGVWHVRGETIRLLREAERASPAEAAKKVHHAARTEGPANTHRTADPVSRRLARFLSACAVYRAARRPASLEALLRVTRNEGRSAHSL